MTAPYASITERDESNYINSQRTVNTYITSWAPCGPVGTRLALNAKTFYNTYTPEGSYKSGYPVAFLEAEALFNIQAPVYFTRVVPEDALYGGAVVKIGDTTESYSLVNGLASPESFVFADATNRATSEVISILCKADTNGSLGGKYFYLPNREEFVFIKVNARAEQVQIECSADASGSLNNAYFIMPGRQHYVWFDVDSTGVDPGDTALMLTGMTGIKVSVSANATASSVASAIVTACNGYSTVFSATSDEAVLTVTMATAGVTKHGDAGNSGFLYQTVLIGLDASKDVAISGLTGYQATIDASAAASAVATAVNAAISNSTAFTSTIDEGNNSLVTVTKVAPGFTEDALDGEDATSFVFTTVTQGSSQYGSEALLFYSSDPNSRALSFKIYSHQDNPSKAPMPGTFVVAVYNNGVLETEITCSRKADMKDGLGNSLYVEEAMKKSAYLRCLDNLNVSDNEIPASITTALNVTGGTPGTNVTTGDMINAIQPLYNKDDFDITLLLVGGYTDPAYVSALNTLATTRGDCCVINSIPYSIEDASDYLNEIVQYRKTTLNLNTSYVATFSSSLNVYNSSLNRNVYVPSDGYIAGAIINASRNYEIFYPILGFTRGILNNVLDVKHHYTKDEMDVLYNNQINPIRFVPGRGIVIWGQKTMQSQSSALDRLNARLLLCSIKPQMQSFLEANIGELNNDFTRDKITLLLNGLLDTIQAKGGIINYSVTCDPLDPNNPNLLSVQVKLQITPATEYVECTITIMPSGVNFT